MKRQHTITTLALLASLAMTLPMAAQQTPPAPPPQAQGSGPQPPQPQGAPPPRGPGQRGPGPGGPGRVGPGPGGRDGRPDNPEADLHMPPGRWWDDPQIAQSIGLSAAQIKKMDDAFNSARDHLIDLDASVRKAEGGLQPLLDSDPIDSAKVMDQIEKLTQAKAELEKATAQMLLDVRLQLTQAQWKVASLRPPPPPGR